MRSSRGNSALTLKLLLSIMVIGAASEALSDVTTTGNTGNPFTDEFLHIGNSADGSMEINGLSDINEFSDVTSQDGARVGSQSTATGIVTVTNPGSSWSVGGDEGSILTISHDGTAIVTVSDYATITINRATNLPQLSFLEPRIFIADSSGGDGTLNVLSGGQVLVHDLFPEGQLPAEDDGIQIGGKGSFQGGIGALNVTGVDSLVEVRGSNSFINVGSNGIDAEGSLTISDFGEVRVVGFNEFSSVISGRRGATGRINVIEQGQLKIQAEPGSTAVALLEIGRNADSPGFLTIHGLSTVLVDGDTNFARLIVGRFTNAKGFVEIGGGSKLFVLGAEDSLILVGSEEGSKGELHISGVDTLVETNGTMVVGESGRATLKITEGAHAISTSAIVAEQSTSKAKIMITGQGSSWEITDTITLGVDGRCNVHLAAGAVISATDIIVGPKCQISGTGTLEGNIRNLGGVIAASVNTIP